MIETTRGYLRSEPFKASISKLVNAGGLDTKVAYNVMRLAKELEKTLVDLQKEWVELLTKYVKIEDGQFKLNEEKTDFAYLDGVDQETAKAEILAYLKADVKIERDTLKLSDLGPAKLSAADLSVLEPIINTQEV